VHSPGPAGSAAATTGCACPAGCGNHRVDPDEACDDGNLIGHDGCDSRCDAARGRFDDCDAQSARCGDGECTALETCRNCPGDCTCTPVCGDFVCDPGEAAATPCPGDGS